MAETDTDARDGRFARSLRRLREERAWTQEEMARRASDASISEVSALTISKIERGKRGVSAEEAFAIARALDVTFEEMMHEGFYLRLVRNLRVEADALVETVNSAQEAIVAALIAHIQATELRARLDKLQKDKSMGGEESIRPEVRRELKHALDAIDLVLDSPVSPSDEDLIRDAELRFQRGERISMRDGHPVIEKET